MHDPVYSSGTTGRGITEYYGLKTTEVEIVLLAMDTALASIGGVCVGNRSVTCEEYLLFIIVFACINEMNALHVQ